MPGEEDLPFSFKTQEKGTEYSPPDLTGSRYLPSDFAARAPLQDGLRKTHNWMDENLEKAIDGHSGKNELVVPASESEKHLVVRAMWSYADMTYNILSLATDPEKQDRASSNEMRSRTEGLEHGSTPKEKESMRIGMEILLEEMGLLHELQALNFIYQKAASVSGNSNLGIVEGKLAVKKP